MTRGTPPMGVPPRVRCRPIRPGTPPGDNGWDRSVRIRGPGRAPSAPASMIPVRVRTRFRQCFPVPRAVGALHGEPSPPPVAGKRTGVAWIPSSPPRPLDGSTPLDRIRTTPVRGGSGMSRVRDPCRAPYGSRCHGSRPWSIRAYPPIPRRTPRGARRDRLRPRAGYSETEPARRGPFLNFLLDRPATPD